MSRGMEPILPFKGSRRLGFSWVGASGIAIFSSILHPYDHHPLALSTCSLVAPAVAISGATFWL